MAEPAERLMTVAEFLLWDDGSDTRYELVDGAPVAMAPPSGAHGTILGNAAGEIRARLRHRPPCRVQVEAGIRINDTRQWQADLAVTCAPPAPGPVAEPVLIVEVLSPSTRAIDLARKLLDYKDLPGVREIWLIDSERRWVQAWRREPEGWHGRDHIGGAGLASPMLGDEVALDELYLNTGL